MTGGAHRAVVIGSTAWGTTLAILLARNHVPVTLVARDDAEAARLEAAREHPQRLPGTQFPDTLRVAATDEAVANADLVCLAVPSAAMSDNLVRHAAAIAPSAMVLSATKGIDLTSGLRMTELIGAALPGRGLAVLSGPNLSREVAAGLPGTTVVASEDSRAEWVRAAFHSGSFRVYASADVVGVELGGALKNIVAVAGGITDALAFGDNAKAAVITRGLAEITRLGVACGADPLTFQGLAGVGDAIATAYSRLSRNRRLGELIGGGASRAEALATIGETAEAARTIPAALLLASRNGVELPITQALQAILEGELSPRTAVEVLLEREPTTELHR